MIDPMLSLAYSLHSNKGVFALLIGSGVSRSAGIPTGWDIVLDLVAHLSAMHGERDVADLAAWYSDKYGDDPDYSKLLDEIAKSQEERQQLLASYFEPTEEERENGLKMPTKAHKAIARLVASGHIRVIVTTNFDRLIERAIEEEGITPVVLSNADAISGALPLVHQKCCIIKLHGDYQDTRIKNTHAELASYEPAINAILDRIFDEFGLIVCGWSGVWDEALRAAIERCQSRRFTTYWATRGDVAPAAQGLLRRRDGVAMTISDADAFLDELAEKVQAIEDLNQPHPLSVAAAVATTKRLLATDATLIRFHDLVHQELERTFLEIRSTFEGFRNSEDSSRRLTALTELAAKTEILRGISVTAAYWGKHHHAAIISQIVSRLATNPLEDQGGRRVSETLLAIPSAVLLYSMGIAALANKNHALLATVLSEGVATIQGRRQHYLTATDWQAMQGWVPSQQPSSFPASDWLLTVCRQPLRGFVASTVEYERLFDIFEVIKALVFIDLEDRGEHWGPPGRFVWKLAPRSQHENMLQVVRADRALAEGIVATGLFNGDTDTFRSVIDNYESVVTQMASSM